MKARDLASPDGADTLSLMFTSPVAPTRQKTQTWQQKLLKSKRKRRVSAMAA